METTAWITEQQIEIIEQYGSDAGELDPITGQFLYKEVILQKLNQLVEQPEPQQ